SALARILNPFFFASESSGGASMAASTKPWVNLRKRPSTAPMATNLISFSGSRPKCLAITRAPKIDRPPKLEIPTVLPRSSWTDLISGRATSANNWCWHKQSHYLNGKPSRHRASNSHASAVIQFSAAHRRTGCSGYTNNLGVNSLFFEKTSFVRQRHSHELATQIRDADSNLVCRLN